MGKLEINIFGLEKKKTDFLMFLDKYPQLNSSQYTIIPAFIDVHVHFREPGFVYKETILTGSRAAAKGGYTTVFTMPNLNPVSDTVEHIQEQLNIIKQDAVINVLPYGSITINQEGKQIAPLTETANLVIAFSDDGKGVQKDNLMKEAMLKAKALDKVIVAHCEDNRLIKGGYIHDGQYAKEHNHKGICSASEYEQVRRDIELVRETGCKYHVCHVSTKESVELIRKAKQDDLDITCETAPHYLILNDSMLKEDGCFKINPPIRGKQDQEALIKGIQDGTIDMVATDHAPHAESEKNKGLKDSAFGASGIEIAFPLLYTYLVKKNIITMDKLLDLLVNNPRKRFNLPDNNDFAIWDLNAKVKIDPNTFISMGHNTPFKGYEVYGVNQLTVCNRKVVYKK
ncbi:MAG: dihydroorotase [Mycoplasmoidaceae bacterium]|nr:dihydroorotase [Mycoplasmoidaceae bacterium]